MKVEAPIAIPAKPKPITIDAGRARTPHQEWISPSDAAVITKPVE